MLVEGPVVLVAALMVGEVCGCATLAIGEVGTEVEDGTALGTGEDGTEEKGAAMVGLGGDGTALGAVTVGLGGGGTVDDVGTVSWAGLVGNDAEGAETL